MPHTPTIAAIGIGSNLGPRHATIHAGVRDLAYASGVRALRLSPIIETEPVGPDGQGPYLNACVLVETTLGPRTLLHTLLAIERAHGRDRTLAQRWGPRTLDLDLLVFGDRIVDEPGLTVPHPRIAERAFVLRPLAFVAPGLRIPSPRGGRTVASVAAAAGVR